MATDGGAGVATELSRHAVEESEMVSRVGDIVTVRPRGVLAFFRISIAGIEPRCSVNASFCSELGSESMLVIEIRSEKGGLMINAPLSKLLFRGTIPFTSVFIDAEGSRDEHRHGLNTGRARAYTKLKEPGFGECVVTLERTPGYLPLEARPCHPAYRILFSRVGLALDLYIPEQDRDVHGLKVTAGTLHGVSWLIIDDLWLGIRRYVELSAFLQDSSALGRRVVMVTAKKNAPPFLCVDPASGPDERLRVYDCSDPSWHAVSESGAPVARLAKLLLFGDIYLTIGLLADREVRE